MEDQKGWPIVVESNSRKCKYHERVEVDLSNDIYNNFGHVNCGHPLGTGQRCWIKNKHLCPIRTIQAEYKTKTISCEP